MASLGDRMIRAARLDPTVYEEVEHDGAAMGQAIGVVALSAVAAGIGSGAGLAGLVGGTLVSLLAWYVWSFLTYWIGARLFPEPGTRATHGELLRTIGFATTPGVLRVIGVIPVLRGLVFLITGIWMLVAAVIGIRQALDYSSTLRAFLVALCGWLVQIFITAVVFLLLGVRP
ncbi:MAG: YIP1 family protein [Candidatus Rokuibacteriota bacterium]